MMLARKKSEALRKKKTPSITTNLQDVRNAIQNKHHGPLSPGEGALEWDDPLRSVRGKPLESRTSFTSAGDSKGRLRQRTLDEDIQISCKNFAESRVAAKMRMERGRECADPEKQEWLDNWDQVFRMYRDKRWIEMNEIANTRADDDLTPRTKPDEKKWTHTFVTQLRKLMCVVTDTMDARAKLKAFEQLYEWFDKHRDGLTQSDSTPRKPAQFFNIPYHPSVRYCANHPSISKLDLEFSEEEQKMMMPSAPPTPSTCDPRSRPMSAAMTSTYQSGITSARPWSATSGTSRYGLSRPTSAKRRDGEGVGSTEDSRLATSRPGSPTRREISLTEDSRFLSRPTSASRRELSHGVSEEESRPIVSRPTSASRRDIQQTIQSLDRGVSRPTSAGSNHRKIGKWGTSSNGISPRFETPQASTRAPHPSDNSFWLSRPTSPRSSYAGQESRSAQFPSRPSTGDPSRPTSAGLSRPTSARPINQIPQRQNRTIRGDIDNRSRPQSAIETKPRNSIRMMGMNLRVRNEDQADKLENMIGRFRHYRQREKEDKEFDDEVQTTLKEWNERNAQLQEESYKRYYSKSIFEMRKNIIYECPTPTTRPTTVETYQSQTVSYSNLPVCVDGGIKDLHLTAVDTIRKRNVALLHEPSEKSMATPATHTMAIPSQETPLEQMCELWQLRHSHTFIGRKGNYFTDKIRADQLHLVQKCKEVNPDLSEQALCEALVGPSKELRNDPNPREGYIPGSIFGAMPKKEVPKKGKKKKKKGVAKKKAGTGKTTGTGKTGRK